MKKHLHIVSQPLGSIGEITRDLVIGLSEEFIITEEFKGEIPIQKDILLCHFVNPIISQHEEFNQFKHRVLIQPIDGTEIVSTFVEEINKYDLIITPGNAGKNIMIKNGVIKPIVVIPNYYKEEDIIEDFKDNYIKQIPLDRIILYHESTFHPRKGIEILYESYVKAFSDTSYAKDVVLVLKDMPFNKLTYDRIEKLKKDTIQYQRKCQQPADIIKISQYCTTEQLKKLWFNTDIYVSFAKIEGFGIPLLRMAAMHKPIVTLDNYNCGYMDYLNYDNSYLSPTVQVIAEDEHMNMYTKNTLWGIPKIDDIIDQLRQVVKEIDSGNSGKLVSDKILETMKYESVIKKYSEVLKSLQ